MKHSVTLILGRIVLLYCVCEGSLAQLTGQNLLASKQFPFLSNISDSSTSKQDPLILQNTSQPSGNRSNLMNPSSVEPHREVVTVIPSDSVTSNNTMSDNSNTTEQVPNDANTAVDLSQCLTMTYNNTKQIFRIPAFAPPEYNYKIWFKPLKAEESISIQFDFSLPGTNAEFPKHSFSYSVTPLQWHTLEILAGKDSSTKCRRWAEFKISVIDIQECLRHHTISRIQVSSAKNLVLWSTRLPQGNWWDEISMTVMKTTHSAASAYVLATCLAAALIALVIVGAYAWRLRTAGQRNTAVEEDSIYTEWNEIQPTMPVTITPPSSASYNSTTGTLNTMLSS